MSDTGTAPLSQLDAVNMMLSGIFEAPVNTLDTAIADVATAKRLLGNVVRGALLRGVANNSEDDVTLSVDTITGKIPLPGNCLRVRIMESDAAFRSGVQRGAFLYDRVNHTFTWSGPVKAEVFYNLEWDDLPEHVKYACAVAAARRFQKHVLGDSDKGGYDKEDELESRAILMDADSDVDGNDMYTDSWSVAAILER